MYDIVRIIDMDSDMAKDNANPLSNDHVAAQNSNVPIVIT